MNAGYQDSHWWSPEGWQWKESNRISEPGYWRDPKWNGKNQPVVRVSYHEAEAFAAWAGGRLPTEREWEAAARGPEGYEWPWGNNWTDGICNSDEAKFGSTSPVGVFPQSRSNPFGFDDLAGNVWEWCADWWDANKLEYRVLRGGSWFSNQRVARSAVRNNYLPADGYFVGFRLVGVCGQDSSA